MLMSIFIFLLTYAFASVLTYIAAWFVVSWKYKKALQKTFSEFLESDEQFYTSTHGNKRPRDMDRRLQLEHFIGAINGTRLKGYHISDGIFRGKTEKQLQEHLELRREKYDDLYWFAFLWPITIIYATIAFTFGGLVRMIYRGFVKILKTISKGAVGVALKDPDYIK